MVVTYETTIPSDEDLTVPEVNVSGVVLRAASFHLGKYCEDYNNVSIGLYYNINTYLAIQGSRLYSVFYLLGTIRQ